MTDSENTKACIACAEEIKLQAQLCKHCNTRQDEKSFKKPPTPTATKSKISEVPKKSTASSAKSSPAKPKKRTPASSRRKSKKGQSLNENQMLFGGLLLLAAILIASGINTGVPDFSNNTSSTSTEAPTEEISPLRGDVGIYYCEPNLCELLITNTGSEPIYVSGDLCGVVGGNVYEGYNSVSVDLNPKATYGIDFSFLGNYEGDSLDKVWLGDCSDESSAKVVWNNPSTSSSTGSQGKQEQASQTTASSGSGLNSGSKSSGKTEETTELTAAPVAVQPSPAPTPTNEEKLRDWATTIQATIVSERYNTTASWYEATVSFTFAPYPLSRENYFGIHTFDSQGGEELSKWETTFSASLGMTSSRAVIVIDEDKFTASSRVSLAIHDGANMAGSPMVYISASR